MRVVVSFALFAVLSTTTSAAYTDGWQPGKPYTKYLTSSTTTGTAGSSIPTSPTSSPQHAEQKSWSFKDIFNLENILTQGPVSRVIQKFGFNVTAQLEMARQGIPPRFAPDIPLLTDANYEDELLNEQYASQQEEDDRVWAIMWYVRGFS